MGRSAYAAAAIFAACGVFCLREIASLRNQVHAQERGVEALRDTHARTCRDLLEGQDRLCDLLSAELTRSEESWSQALAGIGATIRGHLEQADELRGLIDQKTESLAHAMGRELADRRTAIDQALRQAAANAQDITAVKRRLSKDARSMKEAMIYPTVQLRGNGTVGSGVVVFSRPLDEEAAAGRAATLILTAYHVILEVTSEDRRDAVEDVRLMGAGDQLEEKKLRARVLTFDRKRDIALLHLLRDEPVGNVAQFASPSELAAIEIFEPAYAVGCPLGNMPLPSHGEITTKQKVVDEQMFWMLNAPTYFGNSGGGVFLARDGRLIGVSSMIYTYGRSHPVVVPHLGLFVPADSICAWLDEEGFGFIHDPRKSAPKDLASLAAGRAQGGDRAPEPELKQAGFRSEHATP